MLDGDLSLYNITALLYQPVPVEPVKSYAAAPNLVM